MNWLNGYKTFIVFGLVILNGIVLQLGWGGFELPPEWQKQAGMILSAVALILRWFSSGPALPGLRGKG